MTPAYRAPTFTLAVPRERSRWERALVAVGRRIPALRWFRVYRRAIGGRWVTLLERCCLIEPHRHHHAHSWQRVDRCPAEWSRIGPGELDGMLCDAREHALRLNLTHDMHVTRCTCEVYP